MIVDVPTDQRDTTSLSLERSKVGANLIARTAHGCLKLLDAVRTQAGLPIPVAREPGKKTSALKASGGHLERQRHIRRGIQRHGKLDLKDSLWQPSTIGCPIMVGDSRKVLLAEVRETFARTAWTHKTHEKACDLQLTTERRLRTGQIVLTAITSGSVLSLLAADEAMLKVVAAVLSLLSTGLSLYARNFTPGATAEKHRDTAVQLWVLREQYVHLIGDLSSEDLSVEEGRKRRDDLLTKLGKIYAVAPRTTPRAYKQASAGLKENEELTFSQDEIDLLLPDALRRRRGDEEVA